LPADAWSDPVTEMSAGDARWAAELMERRRRDYVRYSPVFWRPETVGERAEQVRGDQLGLVRGKQRPRGDDLLPADPVAHLRRPASRTQYR
jgi:hypothetical protein